MAAFDFVDIERIQNEPNLFRNFDCGNALMNDFLKCSAYYEDIMKMSSTYLILGTIEDEETELIGYFTLSAAPFSYWCHDDGALEEQAYNAVYLKMIAIDTKHKRCGFGTDALLYVTGLARTISDQIGCRLLLLEAVPDAIEWYKDRGFIQVKDMDNFMVVDFKDFNVISEYENS